MLGAVFGAGFAFELCVHPPPRHGIRTTSAMLILSAYRGFNSTMNKIWDYNNRGVRLFFSRAW